MRALHVPEILVTLIGFTYRYLFVLTDEVLRLLRARQSRHLFRRQLSRCREHGRRKRGL